MLLPGHQWVSLKKFQPIWSSRSASIANTQLYTSKYIYVSEKLYYKEFKEDLKLFKFDDSKVKWILQIPYNLLIYIIKQDIHICIYVAYSRPNGWTDWADKFCGHSWVAGGCYRLNKMENIFSEYFVQIFFFHWQRRALQLVAYILRSQRKKQVYDFRE